MRPDMFELLINSMLTMHLIFCTQKNGCEIHQHIQVRTVLSKITRLLAETEVAFVNNERKPGNLCVNASNKHLVRGSRNRKLTRQGRHMCLLHF